MKLLIAFDGTLNAKQALRYSIGKLREEGGRAVVVSAFDSSMFVDYGAGPNAETRARAESHARVREAQDIIAENAKGIWMKVFEREGDLAEAVLDYLNEEPFDAVVAPPKLKGLMKKAPCPVLLVPGTILVPVDDSQNSPEAVSSIIREAKASGSRAILLGLVPEHLYGIAELDELKRVEAGTRRSMRELKEILAGQGIETAEAVRFGYPDDEIMKAMEEFAVSLIMIPTAFDAPSEINKAADIIRDEGENKGRAILVSGSLR